MWEKIIHAKIEFYQDIHEEENDLQHVKFVISKISRQFEGAHTEESYENLYFFMKSVPEVTKNIHEFFWRSIGRWNEYGRKWLWNL